MVVTIKALYIATWLVPHFSLANAIFSSGELLVILLKRFPFSLSFFSFPEATCDHFIVQDLLISLFLPFHRFLFGHV